MCVICGCNAEQHVEHDHAHEILPGTINQTRETLVAPNGDLHYGMASAKLSVPGMSQTRAIHLEADVLDENKRFAKNNRTHFAAHGVTALNLLSSPGSGKTTLLCATILALKQSAPDMEVAVIEGDQQTSVDADRIRATGVPAIQVNTGRGCHLDAQMVSDAFRSLDLHTDVHHEHDGHLHHHDHHQHSQALLLIENVGNLVCPAMWDLGESAKVVVLSVTEGDDKPLKYPDMFAAAGMMLINKIDLLPYVNFDLVRCIQYARQVNPHIEIIQISATRGDGMDTWLHWLRSHSAHNTNPRHHHGSSAVLANTGVVA